MSITSGVSQSGYTGDTRHREMCISLKKWLSGFELNLFILFFRTETYGKRLGEDLKVVMFLPRGR